MKDLKTCRWGGAAGLACIGVFLIGLPLYFVRGPFPSVVLFLVAPLMAVARYPTPASNALPKLSGWVGYSCALGCVAFVACMLAGHTDPTAIYNPAGWGPSGVVAGFPLAAWMIAVGILVIPNHMNLLIAERPEVRRGLNWLVFFLFLALQTVLFWPRSAWACTSGLPPSQQSDPIQSNKAGGSSSEDQTGLTLIVTPSSLGIVVGEPHVLRVTDKDGRPVEGATWKVGDATIARVETNGRVSVVGLSPGTTTITVAWKGNTGQAKVHVLGAIGCGQETRAWQARGEGSARKSRNSESRVNPDLVNKESLPTGSSGDAESHYQRGLELFDAGDLEGAAAEYNAALQLKPDFAEAQTKLAYTLWRGGAPDEAISAAKQALRLNPNNPEAEKTIGLALVDEGDLNGAFSHYQEALRLKPDYVDAHIDIAIVLNEQGRRGVAIEEYRKAIHLDPDNQKAHYNLAILLHDAGDFAGSVAENRESVRLHPQDPAALINLADSLRDVRDLEGSVKYYRQAIDLAPDIFVAHYGLCQTLIAKGDYQGAAQEGNIAVSLVPEDADAWCNLGIALLYMGDITSARKALTRAHEIAPDDPRIKKYYDAVPKASTP
jgi:tetratricopeptide (TPR) repeat protein